MRMRNTNQQSPQTFLMILQKCAIVVGVHIESTENNIIEICIKMMLMGEAKEFQLFPDLVPKKSIGGRFGSIYAWNTGTFGEWWFERYMAERVVQLYFGVYGYIGPIQMECFIGKWQENMMFKAKSLIQDIYVFFSKLRYRNPCLFLPGKWSYYFSWWVFFCESMRRFLIAYLQLKSIDGCIIIHPIKHT